MATQTGSYDLLAAKEARDSAYNFAQEAKDLADTADKFAKEAERQAGLATIDANTARFQLTQIENVVGALNWIAEHGDYTLTQDPEVIEGKWYFEQDGQGKWVVVQLSEGTNPHDEGYYELTNTSESINNYIRAHLFLDGLGLHVANTDQNGDGSQVLITEDAVRIIDRAGVIIAEYADKVTLGNPEGVHLELSPTDGLGFFQDNQTRVAYMKQDKLYIANSEVTNSLRIGKFMWIVRNENRISLRYEPEEEV